MLSSISISHEADVFFSKDHVVTEKDASEKKVVGEKTV